MDKRILVINPGSTSTKVAVYDGKMEIFSVNVEHNAEQLRQCLSSWTSILCEEM